MLRTWSLRSVLGAALGAAAVFALSACIPEVSGQDPSARREEARSGRTVLDYADDHGIDPTDIAAADGAMSESNHPSSSANEAIYVAAALRYAEVQHGRRLDPSGVNPQWAIRAPPYDPRLDFNQARRERRLQAWLQGLAPQLPAYVRLLDLRRRYRTIVELGGWAPVDAERTLREGDSGPQIAALRIRLSAEGFQAAPESELEFFDAQLATALAQFQAVHGLPADGVLGRATIAALDVPAERRFRQIELNMERLRWLPRELPATRVEVNIPTAELVYYEEGEISLAMRTIVGTRANKTPSMITDIRAIILNPPWNVPTSIARNEILPLEAAEPGYLTRNGYVLLDGRLQQAPGPGNALGRIKFETPNPFGVYMHDTPAPQLFQRERRALSHGCVRVEHPRDLAEALLQGQGWSREDIEAAIEEGATQAILLAEPVPVFVLYQTVLTRPDGTVRFALDLYGWDAELERALAPAALTMADAGPLPPTMCSASSMTPSIRAS